MRLSYPALVMQAIVTSVPKKYIYILLTVIITLFSACSSDFSEFENRQIDAALSDSLFTITESWDFEMEVIEDGYVRLRLQGAYAASINNEYQNLTKISGPVFIEIYSDSGETETIVEADSAIHHPNTSEFEMFGDVRVQAADGKRLYSEYLKWQRTHDRVSTSDFVIFISPPDSISAKGFFGNTDLSNYTLNEGGGRVIID